MGQLIRNLLLLLLFSQPLLAIAEEERQLVIVLDWFINPNHAPLLVAETEGFFKQQGLKVKLITPADSSSGEKMVAAKHAEIAVTYQPALLYHVVEGLPLVRFATLIDSPLNCLIVLAESKIDSLAKMAGKKIGYSGSVIDEIILAKMLKAADLKLNQINLINVKFNLTQALLSKKIDGFIGGMRNFETVALEFNGKKTRLFYPEKYGLPRYEELILVAHKDLIPDPILVKFNTALKQGALYLKREPQQQREC